MSNGRILNSLFGQHIGRRVTPGHAKATASVLERSLAHSVRAVFLGSWIASTFVPSSGALAERIMSSSHETDVQLDVEFKSALKRINGERKTNNANGFSITHFFAGFYKLKQTDPYISYFESIGMPTIRLKQNQQFYVYFELTADQLSSHGYRDFRRGDRMVIVFTTESEASSEITSFSASLFGRTLP